MHTAGLCILDPSTRTDGGLGFDVLRDLLLDRIHLIPRFRQKVLEIPFGLGLPAWVDDPGFHIDEHLHRMAARSPGGPGELWEVVGELHSTKLDRSRPLWDMYLIEGLAGGRIAVYTKTHHAMIDGISGMDIAEILFDPAASGRSVGREAWDPDPSPSLDELIRWSARREAVDLERAVAGALGRLASRPAEVVAHAAAALEGAGSFLRHHPAPASPFNGPVGSTRRFAAAQIPLLEAREVKKQLGGTVNDVVLAAMGGALHRFLERRGLSTEHLALRAMVPVNLRGASQRTGSGNRVSSRFVDVPVGAMAPAERLRETILAGEESKQAHQEAAGRALIRLGDFLPPPVDALAVRRGTRTRFANLVVSNIPGVQVPLYFVGCRVLAYYPVMPLAPEVALSVAVVTLSGVMGFGFTADHRAVPDLERLPEDLMASFDGLREAAGRVAHARRPRGRAEPDRQLRPPVPPPARRPRTVRRAA